MMPVLKKMFGGLLLVALVFSVFTLQATAAASRSASSSSPQAGTQGVADPISALQGLGLSPNWNLGPVSVGSKYDSELGVILDARYRHQLNEAWALGLLGEYGPNQYRVNATVGTQLGQNTQVKFTGEYLSQELPFYFDAGRIDERVGQSAYGMQLRQNFDDSLIKNLQAGGYWSKAPSVALPSFTIIRDAFAYTNARNLAGSTSTGFDIGSDLALSPSTIMNVKLLYNDVNYDTRLTPSSAHNRSGFGGALQLDQSIDDRTKFLLRAENRITEDSYGGELCWTPSFAPLAISLSAQRLIPNSQAQNSNIFGLNISFALNDGSSGRDLAKQVPLSDLTTWVAEPAVRLSRVAVEAEQTTTLNGPVAVNIVPNSGPLTGGALVTINGSNFLPGVTVTVDGVNAVIISVTPTQIIAEIPVLVVQDTTSLLGTMLAALSPISAAYAADPTRDVEVVISNPDGQRWSFMATYVSTLATLVSLTPDSGTETGGTTVTITGTHFTNTSAVTFGGVAGTSVTVVNDTTLTVVTPAHAVGAVDVVVTTPQGSGTLADGYTYIAATPTVTSISPNSGSTAGGGSVTITGTNFTSTTSVTFGGGAATSVTVVNDTTITAVTPAHAAGAVDVVITTPAGSGTATSGFTYIAPPAVTSLSPTSGSTSGGTSVVITGTNFANTTAVNFGSSAAASFTVDSATQITATSPAGSAGTVAVTVTSPLGTSATSSADEFTYVAAPTVTSISPTSGSTSGGTSVVITGTNFADATAVNFGSSAAASFTVDSTTQITAVAPAGSAGAVNITVTTAGGTSPTSSADQFTYNTPVQIIFVTSSSYNGNLGGFSGADAKCNSDSAKPSSGFAAGYTYKALLNGNNATTSGVSYYRTNGLTLIDTATGGNLVGAGFLISSISSNSAGVWTGNGSNSCANWTSTGVAGTAGLSSSSSSAYWNSGPSSCSSLRRLYCVSQ
jgi:hypothetical protein